jgi:hypothetical protein
MIDFRVVTDIARPPSEGFAACCGTLKPVVERG